MDLLTIQLFAIDRDRTGITKKFLGYIATLIFRLTKVTNKNNPTAFYYSGFSNSMAAKRKLSALSTGNEEPVDPADEFMFLCLGGGNEVGRSCHIIQYKGKTVMVSARCCLSH